MYSVVCLFPWLPICYNFYVGVMRVFEIPDNQIACLRIQRADNLIIFSVVSEEVFNRLSEFYFRILYFPFMGLNILECFVYPQSPRFRFIRMSAYPAEGMADTLIGNLSLVGTVLYQRHLSFTNSIGVVLQMMDKIKSEPNDSAVPAIAPPNSQCLPGNWQENQIAVRAVPNIPVSGASSGGTVSIVTARSTTVGYQQLIGNLGNLRLKSESPYPYQRPQISAFQARESGPYGRNARRYRGLSGYINNSSTIGRFSPYQVPVKEERVAQRPSPKDEHPSDNPTVKEEYPESSSD